MIYFLHKLPVLSLLLFEKWKNESLAFRDGSLLTGNLLVKKNAAVTYINGTPFILQVRGAENATTTLSQCQKDPR